MGKTSSTEPFKELEEDAFYAFKEWPIWLAIREKELAEYLAGETGQTGSLTVQTSSQPVCIESQARKK